LNSSDAQTRLPGALQALGLDLSPRAQGQLLQHLALIAKWNRVYNLTAVRDPAEMFTHHLLDSLASVRPLVGYWQGAAGSLRSPESPPSSGSTRPEAAWSDDPVAQLSNPSDPALTGRALQILDVGSGAGLPGVALAIALPELLHVPDAGEPDAGEPAPIRVTCVDAVAKKAGFIRQVAAELGLPRLQVAHGRVEALNLPAMDLITCRAFASLADIVRLTRGHLAPGGVWMALKGAVPHAEMAELPQDVEVFHVEPLQVPQLDAQRCLVWMRPRPTTV
jgi:16S rRNA (guanine527-N7)-methyltransferase